MTLVSVSIGRASAPATKAVGFPRVLLYLRLPWKPFLLLAANQVMKVALDCDRVTEIKASCVHPSVHGIR